MISPFFKVWPFSCGCLSATFITFFVATLGMTLVWPSEGTASEKDKIVIGAIEKVIIMPWSIELPARIDSGAARTSLDARDLKAEGSDVTFCLPAQYGGKRLRLPVKGWKQVKSSHGKTKRPLVEIDVCLGTKRITATVSLIDRSQMSYPIIIGRDILAQGFVVDVAKPAPTSPSCPDGDRK